MERQGIETSLGWCGADSLPGNEHNSGKWNRYNRRLFCACMMLFKFLDQRNALQRLLVILIWSDSLEELVQRPLGYG
jgi:hypothetical protein